MEKIHDFGELGKYSKSTIKANTRKECFGDGTNQFYLINTLPIEKDYNKKNTSIEKNIKAFEYKKYCFPRLTTIIRDMRELEEQKKRLKYLNECYEKYQDVLSKIYPKR